MGAATKVDSSVKTCGGKRAIDGEMQSPEVRGVRLHPHKR